MTLARYHSCKLSYPVAPLPSSGYDLSLYPIQSTAPPYSSIQQLGYDLNAIPTSPSDRFFQYAMVRNENAEYHKKQYTQQQHCQLRHTNTYSSFGSLSSLSSHDPVNDHSSFDVDAEGDPDDQAPVTLQFPGFLAPMDPARTSGPNVSLPSLDKLLTPRPDIAVPLPPNSKHSPRCSSAAARLSLKSTRQSRMRKSRKAAPSALARRPVSRSQRRSSDEPVGTFDDEHDEEYAGPPERKSATHRVFADDEDMSMFDYSHHLPSDIKRVLDAIRNNYSTGKGPSRPVRIRIYHELQELGYNGHFGPRGDILGGSTLRKYSLDELGMTPSLWDYLDYKHGKGQSSSAMMKGAAREKNGVSNKLAKKVMMKQSSSKKPKMLSLGYVLNSAE